MMAKNGMTRYNCDLVRRKDKVKARKAEGSSAPQTISTQQQGPSTISLPTPSSRASCSIPSGLSDPPQDAKVLNKFEQCQWRLLAHKLAARKECELFKA